MTKAAKANSASPTQVDCQTCAARRHLSGVIRSGQVSSREETRSANRCAMTTVHKLAPMKSPADRNQENNFHHGSLMMDRSGEFLSAFLWSNKYVINGHPYPISRPP